MTVTVVGLALLAAVLWPAPPRPSWGRDDPVRRSTPAATLDQAATALVMLAAVLRGGGGTVESLEAVAAVDDSAAGRELSVVAAAHRWGESGERAWSHVGPGWDAAATAWHAALAAGAAPADLVEAAAGRIRRAETARVEAAAHRAGVLLVLPLGACFLPGFVATTVVPVVLLLIGGRT